MAKRNGFSLIELLIVIAIVAILATIAVPAYGDYIVRANRRAAQAEMMEIANRERQYLLANRTYADEATLPFTLADRVSENYTVDIEVGTGNEPTFVITFEPKVGSRQANDVTLILNSEGVKTPPEKW